MFKRKAISPVVAMALLLVVAVVSAVGFQGWFNNYSQSTFGDVEKRDGTSKFVRVEALVGDNLYLNSGGADSLIILKIVDARNGTTMCEIDEQSISDVQSTTRVLFSFDNSTYNGSHVLDYSGYNNSASVVGPSFTSSGCISNGCFNYDGSNDYMSVPSDSSISFGTGDVSVSLWMAKDAMGSNSIFLSKGGGIGRFWIANDVSNDNIYINSYFGPGTDFYLNLGATTTIDNSLHHIVATYDKDGNETLYIDGERMGAVDISSANATAWDSTNALQLSPGLISFYNGTIDELGVYSKVLTQGEVESLYLAKKALRYEHILPEGGKAMDISNCNIVEGREYNVVGFTQSTTLDQSIIAK